MVRAWFDRARPVTSVVAALLLMFISLGMGGTAFAKSGNNGNGQAAATSQTSPKSSKSTTTQKSTAPRSTTTKKSTAPKSTTTRSTGSSKAGSHSTSGTAGTSGDATKPQPVSNADSNTGGANGQCPSGPYCSTRDGSPSKNGNGGGASTGKPCAGCVGKADNKNPKGQLPGPQDRNNGYECDGNNGIAKGNPAHTACAASTPPPPCVPTPQVPCVVTPPGDCVPPVGHPTCVVTPPGTPGTPPGDTTPPKGVELNRPPAVLGVQGAASPSPASAQVQANAAAAQPTQGALPNTGAGDLTGLLAATGVGLVIVGGATLAMRRRSITG